MELLKNEVASIANLAYVRGLVYGVGGNISVKADREVYITPKGAHLRSVIPRDIVLTDIDGKTSGRVSIELPMHLAIYCKYPMVNAIVHTHSPYATVWSKTRRPFQSKTVEGRIVLGEIPVVCGAKPGSKELAEMVVEKLKNKRAVLLENHGSVAVGPSLDEAFNLAETIEETAKIEIIATILTKNL